MKGTPLPTPGQPTLNAALAEAARGGDGVTFVADASNEQTMSWSEIAARARRLAAGMQRAGVSAGDRVALVLPTSPSFVVTFFAALLARAVPVPLYPPVRLGRLDEYHGATAAMIAATDARLVVSEGSIRRLLGEAVARARPQLGCLEVTDLDLSEAPRLEAAAPEDLALVQFSSGTTRHPRPVALSHAALIAQCAALRPLLRGSDDAPQRGVSWLPLYHDMGLIGALLGAVTYPGPLSLIPPERFLARPALWLQTIARHRATISPAPPFAFALCTRRIGERELQGCDLSSWRLAICGAEPIAPGVLEAFVERFAPYGFRAEALAPGYGLAEAALAVTCTVPPQGLRSRRVDPRRLSPMDQVAVGERRIVSVGAPVAGTEVSIRGDDGRLLTEETIGRIWVRGPTLMQGYLNQEEVTAEVLRDGWLDTGDLGFCADGRLYVVGRAKEIIIVRGVNHWPQEFEDCLAGVAGMRAGRALASGFVPAGGEGEALLVLAERALGRPPEEDPELSAAITRRLMLHTGIRPERVVILAPGTLLRTSSGKLRRQESVQRYLQGELRPPRRGPTWQVAGALLRSAARSLRARWRP